MGRTITRYRCAACGAASAKWVGRCGGCGEWNALAEESPHQAGPGLGSVEPIPITEVDGHSQAAIPTGVHEVDRVLGGGLVPGSATLLGGEPGIGKSTLLLQVAAAVGSSGRRALLVSSEESAAQVRMRAERLGAAHPRLWITPATDLGAVVAALESSTPAVAVIDSIQTLADPHSGGAAGTVTQVRACAQRLVAEAKQREVAMVLIGHVTKEGGLAGPRALEHMVDTVLSFDGDRHHGLRMLRATKHRFGATGGVGLLEMTTEGLRTVDDASGYLLADRRHRAPGSVVVPVVDGGRALLVEVQALVAPSPLAQPRRRAQGLDSGRLGIVLAVLAQRAGLAVAGSDVWAAAVGGVRVGEPGADLAVAVAVASAVTGASCPADVAVCGEVGLSGEVRHIGQLGRRLAEVARLGFRRAVVPPSAPEGPPELEVVRAATVADALDAIGLPVSVGHARSAGGSRRPSPRSSAALPPDVSPLHSRRPEVR